MQFWKKLPKTWESKNIKLLTTERTRNHSVSESNYHTTIFYTENVLAIEMKNTQILMNRSIYLGLSKLWVKL